MPSRSACRADPSPIDDLAGRGTSRGGPPPALRLATDRTDRLRSGGFEEGQRLKSLGELPAAIECYRACLIDEPGHGWAQHCLAQALFWTGEREESVARYLEAAATLPPFDQAVPLCQVAEVHALDRRLCDAWSALERARERNPDCTSSVDYSRALGLLAKAVEWSFDAVWYRDQVGASELARAGQRDRFAAALHYLRHGHRERRTAHWILDTDYIATQLGDPDDAHAPALLRFIDALERGEPVSPGWIVDVDWMLRERRHAGHPTVSPLSLFRELADAGFDTAERTSPLFDPAWYRRVAGPDAAVPIRHYLLEGFASRLSPHPAFRSDYYAAVAGLGDDDDPVRHYLVERGCREHSPNPVLDLEHYRERFPDFDAARVPALVHFLELEDRRGTLARFDRDHYLARSPDIGHADMCPERHFVEYGFRECHREPFAGFSPACIRSRHRAPARFGLAEGGRYWAQRDHRRDAVLVVSHSASRTGAPLIALRIVEELSRIETLDVTVVVFDDGPLVARFRRFAHVLITADRWGADPVENAAIIDGFVDRRPIMSFCNSSESRHFARSLSAADLRVVSLVHEVADHYESPGTWAEIFEHSDRVVFPSWFVKDRSERKLAGYLTASESEAVVLPQGLLTRNFARFGAEAGRLTVRRSLGMGDDEVLVLGCGSMDLRKGIDLFLRCAIELVADPEASRVRFLWLGGSQPQADNDNPVYWAMKALGEAGSKRLSFVPSTADVEPYYQAADLFLLSSRSDPYPCVMHEALAAGLPIVYMADSGGSAELVADRFGACVPYEDVSAMSRAVLDLASDGALRASLGAAAAAHAHERCGFVPYVNELLRLGSQVGADPVGEGGERRASPLAGVVVPERPDAEIYFLNPDWGISGINSITETLVERLNARGLRARLLFTRGRLTELCDDAAFLPDVPIDYLDVDPDAAFPDNVHEALLERFRHHDPCVLVTNYDYVASTLSPRLSDHVGVVGVVQSDDAEHYEHANRLGHHWNRIVGVSERIVHRIAEMNPSFRERTVCIPNGVPPILAADDLARDRRDATRTVRLVYTGRVVHPQKRVERYVELVGLIERRGIDYEFDIVGDGEAREFMERALAPQARAGRVRFHGRRTREETAAILSRADVFTLFSDFEGMPLSLLEAVGAGCIPVLFGMEGGINDLVDRGRDGFVCDSRTVAEAVDVIESLQDPDQRRALRDRARSLLDRHGLTADAMTDAYAQVFEISLKECREQSFVRPRWIHDR